MAFNHTLKVKNMFIKSIITGRMIPMKKIIQIVIGTALLFLIGLAMSETLVAPVIVEGTFIPALTSGTVTNVALSSATSGVSASCTNGSTSAACTVNLSGTLPVSISGAASSVSGGPVSATTGVFSGAVTAQAGLTLTGSASFLNVYSAAGNSIVLADAAASGGQAILQLNRGASTGANSSQITISTGGSSDWTMGTSQGSAGASDLSIYDYGNSTNALTIIKSNGNVGIGTTAPTGRLSISSTTNIASSGTDYGGLYITPTYNQTGTASATDLLINRTQTAVGSGAQNLIDAQVGGASKFSVSNVGLVSYINTALSSSGRAYNNGTTTGTIASGITTTYESNNSATITETFAAPTGDGVVRGVCFKNATTVTWAVTAPATAVEGLPTVIAAGQCVKAVYSAVAGTPVNAPATTWVLTN